MSAPFENKNIQNIPPLPKRRVMISESGAVDLPLQLGGLDPLPDIPAAKPPQDIEDRKGETARVVKRLLAEKRPGSIINVSSQMGHVGAPNRTIYCASKWAIEGLTKAMAVELAPHGIRVNTLCPTFIETPLTKPFLAAPGFREQVEAKIKLGRVGQVEDLMGAILLLASDAGALMTGSALLVDGGWTAD